MSENIIIIGPKLYLAKPLNLMSKTNSFKIQYSKTKVCGRKEFV